jgi:LDH2 family malate/lactate/ureidoglycolate dehydrogenase
LPGDAAARAIASARRDGITYDDATWAALVDHAARLGVAMP